MIRLSENPKLLITEEVFCWLLGQKREIGNAERKTTDWFCIVSISTRDGDGFRFHSGWDNRRELWEKHFVMVKDEEVAVFFDEEQKCANMKFEVGIGPEGYPKLLRASQIE